MRRLRRALLVLLPALSLAAGLAAISFICAIVALLSRWDWWLVAVVLSLAPPIIRLVQFFIVWFPPIPILDRMEAVIASPIVITVATFRWFFYARRRYIQREQAGMTPQ